jgi:hypothetical protein
MIEHLTMAVSGLALMYSFGEDERPVQTAIWYVGFALTFAAAIAATLGALHWPF